MLLKDLYSKTFYNNFSLGLSKVLIDFDEEKFTSQIFNEDWQKKELKQRMQHTTFVLHSLLSSNFEKATEQIEEIIKILQQKTITKYSLEFMFFADYIETYGINHFKTAIKTIEFITEFTSCEFAVRPFIIKYNNQMMDKMQEWSLHKNHHVRRLASEGSRPRLPWAMALPAFKKDPTAILPILENLKKDTSEYVRRSVANNLNDIAKDNPQTVISIAKEWKGICKETDAIIKHGARTLLKQGNAEILNLYGLTDNAEILVSNFKLESNKIKIGNKLTFSFLIKNTSNQTQNIRLEYGVYYLRQNKQLSKKIFKITEKQLHPNQEIEITRNQSFKIISTRKFYEGEQQISIILNGREKEVLKFMLTN